jgi:hypothetical protein
MRMVWTGPHAAREGHVIPDVGVGLIRVWNPVAANEDTGSEWQRAVRTANERAAFDASEDEREQIRRYGLVRGRKPRTLGEHHVDDALGHAVMRELVARFRNRT